MVELYKALFIATICLGGWTALSLWLTQKGNRSLVVLVTALIACLSVIPLNGYLTLLSNGEPSVLSRFLPALTLTYGPLIFLLVRSAISSEFPNRTDVLHFTPSLVTLFMVVISELNYSAWLFVVSAQLCVYCVFAIKLLFQSGHLNKVPEVQLSHISKRQSRWALWLCFGLLALASVDIYVAVSLQNGLDLDMKSLLPISLWSCVYINILALKAIAYPEIVVLKHLVGEVKLAITRDNSKTELTPSAANELKSMLLAKMEQEQLYLDNELSAGELAEKMELTTHQLSELLNSHVNQSFYDFLNSYRLEEAKRLLTSPDCNKSITDIAFESGFNNRNSFYRVFKTALGLTPTEYRRQVGV